MIKILKNAIPTCENIYESSQYSKAFSSFSILARVASVTTLAMLTFRNIAEEVRYKKTSLLRTIIQISSVISEALLPIFYFNSLALLLFSVSRCILETCLQPKIKRDLDSIDEAILRCTNKKDFEKLAFDLFSGDRGKISSGYMRPPYIHRILLMFMLFDSSSLLEGIRIVFKNAFEELRGLEVRKKCSKKIVSSSKSWNVIDPEEEIAITWGGGKFFLDKFLHGKSRGYLFEDNTSGIWVTPHYNQERTDFLKEFELLLNKSYNGIEKQLEGILSGTCSDIQWPTSREITYAFRTPIAHFDRPVIFSATIKAKHLVVASKQNVLYEAGLPQKALEHLRNINIHTMFERDERGRLPVVNALFKKLFSCGRWPDRQEIEDAYKNDQKLCERLLKYARIPINEFNPVQLYF